MSAYPLDLNGSETHFPTRPICPDCPKTLDQFDIQFPASPSFTSYPIACEAVEYCAPRMLLLSGGHTAFPDRRIALFWAKFQNAENALACPS